MKKLLVLIFVLLPGISYADIEVSENVEVYIGDGNLTVTLVRTLPLDANKALMRISGIDHELNDIVFLYDVAKNDNGRRLTTKLSGRQYTPFIESQRWGRASQELYLSGNRNPIPLGFDRDASGSADTSSLVTAYQEQASSGKLKSLQQFNRKAEIAETEEEISKQTAGLQKKCGKELPIKVEWSDISDDTMLKFSVSGYCGSVFEGLDQTCSTDEGKAWVTNNVDAIACSFGPKMRLELDQKTLMFMSETNTPNQRDFVRYNLMNLMQ